MPSIPDTSVASQLERLIARAVAADGDDILITTLSPSLVNFSTPSRRDWFLAPAIGNPSPTAGADALSSTELGDWLAAVNLNANTLEQLGSSKLKIR